MPRPKPFRLVAPVAPEDDLQRSVATTLAYLLPTDAIFASWESRNVGPIEGRRRKDRGVVAGWPDCSVWWNGRVVLIELKRERGGTLNDAQRALHPRLAAAGFPVCVCRSVSEVLDAVRAGGIPLRGTCT